MKKKSFLLLFGMPTMLLLLVATILVVYPIFYSSRMSWPKIRDYERLFSEAQILTKLNAPGLVNNKDWPQSISEISPRFVYVESDLVEIIVSSGGINPGWGFHIFTGTSLDLKRVQNPNLIPTVHPRVYRHTAIE